MKDITTLVYNNGKIDIYTGENIDGIYSYLEMIVPPTNSNS